MAINHAGDPVSDEANFFVPAPEQIGRVLSQSSTQKQGESGKVPQAFVRLSLIFLAVSAVFGIIYALTKNSFAIGFAMLFAAFAMLRALNTKRYECNYVGEEGIARYRAGTEDQTKNSLEGGVLRFDQVEHLYTNVIETHGLLPFYGQNAIYQWVDGANKFVLSIMTDQYRPTDPIPENAVISFLRAAEAAWTDHRLPGARARLAAGEAVEFPYRRGGKTVLTADRISIQIKTPVEIDGSELVAINHATGNLEFITAAGTVASHDVYHFADALLFETLVAERFGLERTHSGIHRPEPVPAEA